MDQLILRELHFVARHGLLPIEEETPQPFAVTLTLELPLDSAGRSDHLADTIDYRAVQAVVRSVIEGSRRHLIETLAENIATEVLNDFPALRALTVELTKPRPPVDFQFAGVTVRIRRERK